MARKLALIIGNADYHDPKLAKLNAPHEDVNDLAEVLRDPAIGQFERVDVLINPLSQMAREHIDDFFSDKKPDDLLVLYFSGHGVRDEQGRLHLAVQNTRLDRLRSTALSSDYVREMMDASRSKRQVLILDCCHSGAFAQGSKAAPGGSAGTGPAFEGAGFGRVIITATDATQYAWEGDKVIGDAENSLFTHFLIAGLRSGAADLDRDGRVTLDEMYDYVYERVVEATPKQTPSKWAHKQQGEIIIAKNPVPPVIQKADLPGDLKVALESLLPGIREAAVGELVKILNGSQAALAATALEALQKLADDDSRRVSSLATAALEAHAKKQAAAEEAERAKKEAAEKAAAERLAQEKARQERLAQERQAAERLAREKAEAERLAKEKREAEQAAQAKAEADRLAKEKRQAERLARDKVEAEQAAKVEAQRLLAQQIAQEQLKREVAALYDEALKAYEAKDWATAIQRLDAVLAKDPNHPEAAKKRSAAQRQQKRQIRAAEEERARQEQLKQLYDQGCAAQTARDWSAAITAFEQVVGLEKDYLDTAARLHKVRSARGKAQAEQRREAERLAKEKTDKEKAPPARVKSITAANATQLKTIRVFKGHTNSVRSLQFSSDSQLLVSGAQDYTARVWRVSDGQLLQTLSGHTNGVFAVACSPDSKIIATGSYDTTIRLWQARDGKEIRTLKGHAGRIRGLAFSFDGALLASAAEDSTVRVWQVRDGKEIRVLKGPAMARCVSLSSGDLLMAAGFYNNVIMVWRVLDGQEVCTLKGHANVVETVAFTRDGLSLASGSQDSTIRLWLVLDGKELRVLKGHGKQINVVAYSPDGHLLASGSNDQTTRIWRVSDGTLVHTLIGHTDAVNGVAFSPDGSLLASGSGGYWAGGDCTIRIWAIVS